MGICVVICVGAVWSALHITVKPILIVLGIGLSLVLGVAQCEKTITELQHKYYLSWRHENKYNIDNKNAKIA